jgi:hypothetical protein
MILSRLRATSKSGKKVFAEASSYSNVEAQVDEILLSQYNMASYDTSCDSVMKECTDEADVSVMNFEENSFQTSLEAR